MAQAQKYDSQGQTAQYFYNSTIQQATAVTKALKARFTYRAQSTADLASVDLADDAPPAEELKSGANNPSPGKSDGMSWRLESNLVTFSSNVLKVYVMPDGSSEDGSNAVELRLSTQFNGRILEVIKVPTEPFLRDEYLAQQMQAAANETGSKKKKGAT